MYLSIFPIGNYTSINSLYQDSIDSYEDAIKCIERMGNILGYSEDYIAIVSVKAESFDKIPLIHDNYLNDRNFDNASEWHIAMNLFCIPFYEVIEYNGSAVDSIIDRFKFKGKDLQKGDIVYNFPNRKYFMVRQSILYSDANSPLALFGTEKAYESEFNTLPLYYMRKASEYEIETLGLREKFDHLYSKYKEAKKEENPALYYDELEKYKEQYPWL